MSWSIDARAPRFRGLGHDNRRVEIRLYLMAWSILPRTLEIFWPAMREPRMIRFSVTGE